MHKLLGIILALAIITVAAVTIGFAVKPAPAIATTDQALATDQTLVDASKRAHANDPHAVQVLDTTLSADEAQQEFIPLLHSYASARLIGFKGDFSQTGPGIDSDIRAPYVVYLYNPKTGHWVGVSYQGLAAMGKLGVR